MSARVLSELVYSKFPELGTFEAVNDACYNYIFEGIYNKLYTPSDEDSASNQALKKKLENLKGKVNPSVLGLTNSSLYLESISKAVVDLSKINLFKSPSMKARILESVIKELGICIEAEKEPEKLFPFLLLVIIDANVDQLLFNLQYFHQIYFEVFAKRSSCRACRICCYKFPLCCSFRRNS